MDGREAGQRLTIREREVARLIGLGLTNKAIAARLAISERTVGAHVQNIFNKLGSANRAAVATWWAGALADQGVAVSTPVTAASPLEVRKAATWRNAVPWLPIALALVMVVTSTDTSPQALAESARPAQAGALVYEAKLVGDGEGFSVRYVLADADASAIRFRPGVVEFAVLKPGGNTGNRVAVMPMSRYYTELELTVTPGSNVEFWLDLDTNGYITNKGDHLVDIITAAESLQLQYFVNGVESQPIGPQVTINGLQTGRTFALWALADPPLYEVYLDGRRVVSLHHQPSSLSLAPSFAIFGEGGKVRLSAMRMYSLKT